MIPRPQSSTLVPYTTLFRSPTPGMYVVTSIPLVNRTRATFRSAEFGFFGVCVNTRTHTPRFCGLSCSAGLFVFVRTFARSEEHTSELQSQSNLVCRLLLEKK